MMYSCDADPALKDFSGFAPLFPLPNVVLFPHALLPLQIFEPRYRQMTADALEGERLIAMGLLCPGWQKVTAAANPPIHKMVGLGKIIAHEKLDDGRYYLVLRGIARATVVNEQQVDLPYRIGQLKICEDQPDGLSDSERRNRAAKLTSLFARLFPQVNLQQLLLHTDEDTPLATLCDILLGSMPLATENSQAFLELLDVDARSRKLVNLLEQAVNEAKMASDRTFPPSFSAN